MWKLGFAVVMNIALEPGAPGEGAVHGLKGLDKEW